MHDHSSGLVRGSITSICVTERVVVGMLPPQIAESSGEQEPPSARAGAGTVPESSGVDDDLSALPLLRALPSKERGERAVGSTTPDGAAALPRASVYAQLRQTPRVFAFMAVLIISAISLGAKEVARYRYLDEAFDSEWGLGIAASVAAVAIAVTGLLLGRVIDHRDPRPYVLLALVLSAVTNVVVGFVLLLGPMPLAGTLLSAALDGVALGIMGVASLKVQAAFVRPGAEGAAEFLNILRLGIGGVIGAVVGGMSPDPALTLFGCAALLFITSVAAWRVMAPVRPRPWTAGHAGLIAVLGYLRSAAPLRRLVRLDLVLAFVIPTQLVNLALVGTDAPEIASLSIAAGMIGVLIGRVALNVLGFRGSPRRLVTLAVAGNAALLFISAVGLIDDWLVRELLLLPAVIVSGTICSTYAQGLMAAIVQQQVSEEHRGGLAALLVAGRSLLVALAALAGAAVAADWGPQVLVVTLASGLVVVLVASRRFAAVPS